MRLSDLREIPWKLCWSLIPESIYMRKHGVDPEKFYELKQKYKNMGQHFKGMKYLRFNTRFKGRLNYAYKLGLDKPDPIKSVLDIGTGVGYFPFICQSFGHYARAFDLGDYPLFNDMVEMLGVERQAYSIRAYEKVPDQGVKFDLVTAFLICFNNHNKPGLWNVPEWEFFLKDLASNHLTDTGEVFLHFNYEQETNLPFSNELRQYFLDKGAKIYLNEVHFKSMMRFTYALHAASHCQGVTCTEAAALLGDAPRTVQYWIHRFEAEGFAGLADADRTGRPKKLSEQQLEEIGKVLRESPRKAGLTTNIWDGKTLSTFISNSMLLISEFASANGFFVDLAFGYANLGQLLQKLISNNRNNIKKTPRNDDRPSMDLWAIDEVHSTTWLRSLISRLPL